MLGVWMSSQLRDAMSANVLLVSDYIMETSSLKENCETWFAGTGGEPISQQRGTWTEHAGITRLCIEREYVIVLAYSAQSARLR